MFYNIKIKSNKGEYSLESFDKDIIQREMDLYFASLYEASAEFRSKIKEIDIAKKNQEVCADIQRLNYVRENIAMPTSSTIHFKNDDNTVIQPRTPVKFDFPKEYILNNQNRDNKTQHNGTINNQSNANPQTAQPENMQNSIDYTSQSNQPAIDQAVTSQPQIQENQKQSIQPQTQSSYQPSFSQNQDNKQNYSDPLEELLNEVKEQQEEATSENKVNIIFNDPESPTAGFVIPPNHPDIQDMNTIMPDIQIEGAENIKPTSAEDNQTILQQPEIRQVQPQVIPQQVQPEPQVIEQQAQQPQTQFEQQAQPQVLQPQYEQPQAQPEIQQVQPQVIPQQVQPEPQIIEQQVQQPQTQFEQQAQPQTILQQPEIQQVQPQVIPQQVQPEPQVIEQQAQQPQTQFEQQAQPQVLQPQYEQPQAQPEIQQAQPQTILQQPEIQQVQPQVIPQQVQPEPQVIEQQVQSTPKVNDFNLDNLKTDLFEKPKELKVVDYFEAQKQETKSIQPEQIKAETVQSQPEVKQTRPQQIQQEQTPAKENQMDANLENDNFDFMTQSVLDEIKGRVDSLDLSNEEIDGDLLGVFEDDAPVIEFSMERIASVKKEYESSANLHKLDYKNQEDETNTQSNIIDLNNIDGNQNSEEIFLKPEPETPVQQSPALEFPTIEAQNEASAPKIQPQIQEAQNQAFTPEIQNTPQAQETQAPTVDFKLYYMGFDVDLLVDKFLICAYYIKNILRKESFTLKFINSKLFSATGEIATMNIVEELLSAKYLNVLESDSPKKEYTISPEGEEYFKNTIQA